MVAMEPELEQNFRHNSLIGEENRLLTWESEDTHSNPSVGSSMIPSETSEDRDFVVSDTDKLSYVSHNSSEPFDSYYFCQEGWDKTSVNEVSGSLSITLRLLTEGFMIAGRENSHKNRHSTISEPRWASGGPVSCSVVFLGGEPSLNLA
ncbi:hypothetical protein N7510_002665 [Penicillium lagena]|uniref:uncharacterized protein n=1 Tax=Penicillium lagena TaxID=94218 RepID=UPI0025406DCB|nr:uncharacterized protein N7510_002665 [Penicillium lagena]KAJ5626356.1 hypothetical protein N7510_002665 [Penicillium lagena]